MTEDDRNSGSGYELIPTHDGVPIKAWVKGVPFDPKAAEQLKNTARLPFVFKWVAAMEVRVRDWPIGIRRSVKKRLPMHGRTSPGR